MTPIRRVIRAVLAEKRLSVSWERPTPEFRTPDNDGSGVDNSTVVPIAEDGTLQFQGTERPGIYQVEVRTQDRLQRDFFAVNVDATEADLAEIPLQQAAARVGAETTVDSESDGTTVTADAYNVKRHGREIWGELLLLAVCFMLLESFLSNRGSQAFQGSGKMPRPQVKHNGRF